MDNAIDYCLEPHNELEPQWAKLEDLKAGDTVELHGFDCAQGTVTLQQHWYTGELFFPCAEGNHYVSGCLDDNGHLIGITIRPAATIIPTTQTERTPMSDFNPDDANSVSRFFQGLADKVVLASTLPKEVEDLRKAVDALKADVESYREYMARADEEISNLRRDRQALQDENAQLAHKNLGLQDEYNIATSRWNTACSERDLWHNDYIALSSDHETAQRERDDAQMKTMELEDTVRSKDSELSHIRAERDELYSKLSSIRSALA